jgi:hypothetical protein
MLGNVCRRASLQRFRASFRLAVVLHFHECGTHCCAVFAAVVADMQREASHAIAVVIGVRVTCSQVWQQVGLRASTLMADPETGSALECAVCDAGCKQCVG